MTDNHTPVLEDYGEPWKVYDLGEDLSGDPTAVVVNADDEWITNTSDWGFGSTPANARRIVACVNACKGIPTEQLEGASVAALLHPSDESATAKAVAEFMASMMRDNSKVIETLDAWIAHVEGANLENNPDAKYWQDLAETLRRIRRLEQPVALAG